MEKVENLSEPEFHLNPARRDLDPPLALSGGSVSIKCRSGSDHGKSADMDSDPRAYNARDFLFNEKIKDLDRMTVQFFFQSRFQVIVTQVRIYSIPDPDLTHKKSAP